MSVIKEYMLMGALNSRKSDEALYEFAMEYIHEPRRIVGWDQDPAFRSLLALLYVDKELGVVIVNHWRKQWL